MFNLNCEVKKDLSYKKKLKIHKTGQFAFLAVALLILCCAALIKSVLSLQNDMLKVSSLSYEQRILISHIAKKKLFLFKNINRKDISNQIIEDIRHDMLDAHQQVIKNHQELTSLLGKDPTLRAILTRTDINDSVYKHLDLVSEHLELLDQRFDIIKRASIPTLKAGFNFWRPADTLVMEDSQLVKTSEHLTKATYQASVYHNNLVYFMYGATLILVIFGLWLIWFITLRPLSNKLERNYQELEDKNQRLDFQAQHDFLTQLLNRSAFNQYMNDMMKQDKIFKSMALLLIDLDNFKVINDNYGHHIGDLVLVEFSRRLQLGALENEQLYRLSGDEFAITFSCIQTKVVLLDRIKAIHENLIEKITDSSLKNIKLQCSIGVAWGDKCGSTMNELFSAADMALYHVKAHGRNHFAFYQDITSSNIDKIIKMEQQLQLAINRNEFVIYYQPIVNIKTNQIVRLEVLLRWQHPIKGILPPQEWIAIAERASVLSQINMQVFDRLQVDILKWQSMGLTILPVYVNITESLLLSGMALKRINELHREVNESVDIGIEVTESIILERSFSQAHQQLQHIASAGVNIALDDFGTGFANLSHLNKIPYDVIKIDYSFISILQHDSITLNIVESIINLAKKLGKEVICEGIESESVRDVLLNIGCEYGQGFLYSKPLAFADITQLLNTQQK